MPRADHDAVQAIERAGLVAVVRGASARDAVHVARALVDGGVDAVEITFTTPDAEEAIAVLVADLEGRALVGAGTITDPVHAADAAAAGAAFLVSPGWDGQLLDHMLQTGRAVIPGAYTPSEVMAVVRRGFRLVKLFPGTLGGPEYLEALRAPFPRVRFVPTGGVSVENVSAWFAAGAVAVGVGGSLAPARIDDLVHRDAVVNTARRFVDAVSACSKPGMRGARR